MTSDLSSVKYQFILIFFKFELGHLFFLVSDLECICIWGCLLPTAVDINTSLVTCNNTHLLSQFVRSLASTSLNSPHRVLDD